ncbi:MAG TPA: hypothetical protein VL463_21870 [Kofleriaceae bacterium]|nr:hypothetical protein [Kofleriaceae bacterium]
MALRRGLFALALVPLCVLGSARARAGDNDIVLARLGKINSGPGGAMTVIGQNLEFRALVSELGIVFAPRLLTPSDTLGFGGFQLTADLGSTSISSDASYWRVREGATPAGSMPTLGVFARKGMWFPVPSIEVGAGIVHLMDSQMFAAQGYAKLGLHEGYHDLPLPSFAVRGAASRLMGQRELDLTTASLDLSVSKHFGIGGTWSIDPFAGWNLLWMVPRSQVIDATPNIDPLAMGNQEDSKLNFVFKDQVDIIRQRVFVGAKLQYYVFQMTLEADFALAGSSVDDRAGTDMKCTVDSNTTSCDSPDTSKMQKTYLMSIGMDF